MKQKIILGSQSPRRKSILENAGFNVQIIVPNVEENYPLNMNTAKVPEYLARLKMENIPLDITHKNIFMITADTMLLFKNKLIGKPNHLQEAFETLLSLNNTYHEVITGVCLRKNDKTISFSKSTKVYFKNLEQVTIQNFINTHEVLDKAGAYNIQEYIGVEKIEGDFDNVAGLPIQTVLEKIKFF